MRTLDDLEYALLAHAAPTGPARCWNIVDPQYEAAAFRLLARGCLRRVPIRPGETDLFITEQGRLAYRIASAIRTAPRLQ